MRAAAILLLCGCFPYLETYRPDFHGTVLNEAGEPAAGVNVTACSYSRWTTPAPWNCPREANAVSDADGGFEFPQLREWEWCCLGEAPLPQTVVYTCDADAGAGLEFPSHRAPTEAVVLKMGSGSPRCAEP